MFKFYSYRSWQHRQINVRLILFPTYTTALNAINYAFQFTNYAFLLV